jgi:hypothetical protein
MFLGILALPCLSITFVADKVSPLGLKVLIPFAVLETRLSAPNMRFLQSNFSLIYMVVCIICDPCISITFVADQLSPLGHWILISFAALDTYLLGPPIFRFFWIISCLLFTLCHPCVSHAFVADNLSPPEQIILIPFAAFETRLCAKSLFHSRILGGPCVALRTAIDYT